ncbi:uncharacterized protein B0H18DRAFT_1113418 [Fomitopsis serialis]|uniref:uncharacterized protein n=1 Tax=Fomitopsis serialis TaxID=139415 RepID=UPI0020088678|nr:uncharacterized protein B0H18DRAFT_1113418 [Neoantrodia serialis]KAH9937603.1 hypothetical protein B0H18DRAFT_1113418 [Neoantrodia serialis]
MASAPADSSKEDETHIPPSPDAAISDLVERVAQVSVQATDSGDTSTSKSERISHSPLRVYTRSQAMYLRDSPLVKPPKGMPSLKEWFGDWNEQQASAKKDNEIPSPLTNGRERRFRRDAEDTDNSRPSFRSGLSQPSQMGNFRHQSLRTNDRDKDRDSERERERDMRDREGQERLRNLSDKWDRDRLALSSSVSGLRGKERDSAPHLASTTPARAGQAQGSSLTTRRAEGREPTKRKIGESADDWRRGSDAPRSGRDDQTVTFATDRGRESGILLGLGASHPLGAIAMSATETAIDLVTDVGTTVMNPAETKKTIPAENEMIIAATGTTSTTAATGIAMSLIHVVTVTVLETPTETPMTTLGVGGMMVDVMNEWQPGVSVSAGIGMKTGTGNGLQKMLDRDGARHETGAREREKEAEPAWMETYVPTTSGGGILGGQSVDGELDGIQAWKKGMKEKERQEKESEAVAAAKTFDDVKSSPTSAAPTQPESQLDEIQLFKLMMKREAEKKENEQHSKENTVPQTALEQSLSSLGLTAASINAPSQSVVDETQAIINRAHADGLSLTKSATIPDGSQSLLSVLIPSTSAETVSPSASAKSSSLDPPPEGSRVLASRATSTLPPPPGVAAPPSLSNASSFDASSSNVSSPSTFNPPTGSRLLAFGSRAQPGSLGPEPIPSKSLQGLDSPATQLPPPGVPQRASNMPPTSNPSMLPEAVPGLGGEPHLFHNGRHNPLDGPRMQRSFSPHSSMSQVSGQFDEFHEGQMLGQMGDLRRASLHDRAGLGLANDVGPSYGDLSSPSSLELANANYATGKGSRFAKFFDSKTRDAPPVANRKMSGMAGFPSNAQIPDPRQGGMGLNGGINGNGDTRTMEDIFAMLQNSAQNHRASPQLPTSGRIPSGGGSYGHGPTDIMQQQIHQQQHFPPNNHLDSLYDSRIDDRFVPDGMVPGLRPAPPRSRSREPSGVLFNEQLDDPLHFNARLQQQQQQRNLDQIYPGSVPAMYSQQPGMVRNGGLPLQQQQFRGNPSPISNQNMLGGPGQRLPPGLANLGGRPPHDPSQYLGGPLGGMGGGLQGGIHGASALQQGGFNNLGGGGLGAAGMGGYGGGPQLRGPAPQNPLGLNSMANMGLQNNLELRAASQAQLLGMGGGMGGGLGAGLRGQGPGFVPQHGPSGQLPSHMSMRQQQQQQQQQLPSHLMPHMLPPHLAQQPGLPGGNAQGTQDLMALLMGGHRE